MKNFFSTIIFVALFAVLGFVAYSALPQGSDSVSDITNLGQTEQITQGAAAAAAAPSASNYNAIGMPLDATSTLATADDLANAITGSQLVLEWRADTQTFDTRIPGIAGTNFNLAVGGAYLVLVDGTASNVFSLVGDVPAQTGNPGAIQHSLIGGATCQYNFITVPLDQDSITTADELATAVGDVQLVLEWRADTQTFDTRLPGIAGTNFTVTPGHPYFLCMTTSKSWPT